MNGSTAPSASADDRREEPIPADLESDRAKLVYLAVRTGGPVEVGELKATLGMPGLALFPILEALMRRGHIEHSGGTYTLA